jgi:hypothetical protein
VIPWNSPVRGMPYDVDGAGEWTVAGIHMEYTPKEWAALKNGPLRHRWKWLFHVMRVSDGKDARQRPDPVAIGQYIAGYGAVAVILSVIITIAVML